MELIWFRSIVAAVAVLALGSSRRRRRAVHTSTCRTARIRMTWRRRRTASVWYTAQAQGALGMLDPKTGKVDADPARPGRRAARRDRRARRRRLGHRRRAERHRARRSGDQGGEAVPAAGEFRRRQSQHRDLRPQGHPLVHRPERRLRPRRSDDRQGRGLEGAARAPAPTASPPRRTATSGTPRSPAITSPRSTP